MSEKFRRGDRAFLNRPGFHGDASIGYDISISQHADDHDPWSEAGINIRDCDSSIRIDISIHNDENLQNTIEKIDTLIAILRGAKRDTRAARKEFLKLKKAAESSRGKDAPL